MEIIIALVIFAGVAAIYALPVAIERKRRNKKPGENEPDPEFMPASRYAETSGLTFEQVANQIRRGRVEGRIIDGIWHVRVKDTERLSVRVPNSRSCLS